ncbi:MAG: hypothetical protein JXK50_07025 [Campylobacterales bacterium]|nr:hypothetical protein [Campylobacterales bacterium]
MSNTAISVNIFILVLLIAWNLMSLAKQHPNDTTKEIQAGVLTTHDEADTPATSPIVVKEASCSCHFLLKMLIALQIITLALSVLIYFKF